MSLMHAWEGSLLSLAQEAQDAQDAPTIFQPLRIEASALEQAHRYCKQLTSFHSKSFYISSGLLPVEKKEAVRALYAFCRVTDDIVDQPEDGIDVDKETIRQEMLQWRQRALSDNPSTSDPVALAWAHARTKYEIPHRYAEQLIDGVLLDLVKNRYQTFEELAAYSYGVASTVGLMSMHVIGFRNPDAIPYAIKLGVALQITNILRDVGEDLRNGRIYLPLDELEAFNLSVNDLKRGAVDDRWRNFMRFQIDRNRRLYQEAMPGIQYLNGDGRFAIGASAELYQAILKDIEGHDYDVFNRRSFVTNFKKLRMLPGIWWRNR